MMSPQAIFVLQIVLSLVVFGLLAKWVLAPWQWSFLYLASWRNHSQTISRYRRRMGIY